MATIRPSSDLRNRYNEISDFCHKYNEPIFITKNGVGDLVVLSNEAYECLCGKFELHRLLDEGIEETKKRNGRPAADVLAEIERKLGLGDNL